MIKHLKDRSYTMYAEMISTAVAGVQGMLVAYAAMSSVIVAGIMVVLLRAGR